MNDRQFLLEHLLTHWSCEKMCKDNSSEENIPLDNAASENDEEEHEVNFIISFVLIDNFSFYFIQSYI